VGMTLDERFRDRRCLAVIDLLHQLEYQELKSEYLWPCVLAGTPSTLVAKSVPWSRL
jgi:hypothetical protein